MIRVPGVCGWYPDKLTHTKKSSYPWDPKIPINNMIRVPGVCGWYPDKLSYKKKASNPWDPKLPISIT